MTADLVILGAGPKALAVAAKAHVMRELGLAAPSIVVVDQHGAGGNWTALGGWTDGRHRLGTSPEKDVGFPYRSSPEREHTAEINRRMLEFSWMAFLVERQTYAEWVDRGRPHPHHHVWARYLDWVAAKIRLDLRIGQVRAIDATPGGWVLDVHGAAGVLGNGVLGNGVLGSGGVPGDGAVTQVRGDQLMITGPGSSAEAMLDDPRMLSVAEFWDLTARRALPPASRAAVIGGGETAGSALDELSRHDVMTIAAIAPGPTIYTRGESYFENAMFSDPTGWTTLTQQERRDLIRRTDRGVFSVRVQDNLLGDQRVHHLRGRVMRAQRTGDLIALTLENAGRATAVHEFDLVVDATGGRPLWFLDLFTPEAVDLLELALGGLPAPSRLEEAIDYDLSVRGLGPGLYLPNLAGFAQGPGFPNLSCLGELSNRVLRGARSRAAAGAGAGAAVRLSAGSR